MSQPFLYQSPNGGASATTSQGGGVAQAFPGAAVTQAAELNTASIVVT